MFNPADYFIEILAKKSNNPENNLRVQVSLFLILINSLNRLQIY
jgi:hypothetical protein